MKEPREIVEELEKSAVLPAGGDERFTGYGVMGVTFKSGHALCMRRFPAASIGEGYTSIWHRDPERRWTFIQDREPEKACPRYFGNAVDRSLKSEVVMDWPGPLELAIKVEGDYSLDWRIVMSDGTTTRLMNAVSGIVPDAFWRSEWALKLIGTIGSALLGSGRIQLTGKVPNGQWFMANPKFMWPVVSSSAVVNGLDMGAPGPLEKQANIGDIWIPQKGRFFVGSSILEAFDPARYLSVTSRQG